MAREKRSMVDQYMNRLFAPEGQGLQEIRAALKADGKEGINISPYEGQLLQLLLQMVNARKVVEVGTLYGYSTLWVAQALPADGCIFSLEKDPKNYAKAGELLKSQAVAEKIQLLQGDALETLESLKDKGPFDAIFIDANKSGYSDYLDWAEKNIRKGGLIIGDNTFLFGHLTGETPWVENVSENMKKAMQSFNERLADSSKYTSVMIPTSEGMTVALKNFGPP